MTYLHTEVLSPLEKALFQLNNEIQFAVNHMEKTRHMLEKFELELRDNHGNEAAALFVDAIAVEKSLLAFKKKYHLTTRNKPVEA